MEFVFETDYNAEAMTVMARALRKTVRKKRSRRTHFFGWLVIALGLWLSWPAGQGVDAGDVVTWIALAVMLTVLLLEDRINGALARRRMLPGTARAKAIFTEEGYRSETDMGSTEWKYENISVMARAGDYFVFLFGRNHGQVFDRRTLTGGTAEEFAAFLQEKTGLTVQTVK